MITSKTLRDTNDFLVSVSKKNKNNEPSLIEVIYYILLKELGLSLKGIIELPLPYIIGLLKTYQYVKKLEEKEAKKSFKK